MALRFLSWLGKWEKKGVDSLKTENTGRGYIQTGQGSRINENKPLKCWLWCGCAKSQYRYIW